LYQLWLTFIHRVPAIQHVVWGRLLRIDAEMLGGLLSRLALIEAMYLGFFVLPLVAAGFPRTRLLLRRTSTRARALVAAWLVFLGVGASVLYLGEGRLMPYIPQFFSPWGLGPNDLLGGRPVLISKVAMGGLTLLSAICSTFLLLVVCRSLRSGPPGPPLAATRGADAAAPSGLRQAAAGLCASVLVWQGIAAMVTSVHVPAAWVSYDRYLLPLLPMALCLGVSGLRGSRPAFAVGWVTVAAIAVFSIAGTRDFLVLQRETWKLARWAKASGVPNDRLDAGAAWDGWSFADDPAARNGPIRTPGVPPWWVSFWARATDSSYVIAGAQLPGYDIVRKVEYPSLLSRDLTHVYLLRRQGVCGPL
jgi:hypothetical protein